MTQNSGTILRDFAGNVIWSKNVNTPMSGLPPFPNDVSTPMTLVYHGRLTGALR